MQALTTQPAPTIIAGVEIRQDAGGRYSLNDLHRAAGASKKDGPSYWLGLKKTCELVSAFETTVIPVVSVEGRLGGTFVVKEMVYAYAMWISPAFHLAVIRAYDTLVAAPSMAIPQNFAQALRLAAAQQEQLEVAHKQITLMQPQVAALARLADGGRTMCQRDAAKHLQLRPSVFTRWLLAMGWTYRRTENSRLTAFQDRLDRGHLIHKFIEIDSADGATRQEAHVRVTPKGLARLACLIEKGEGPK